MRVLKSNSEQTVCDSRAYMYQGLGMKNQALFEPQGYGKVRIMDSWIGGMHVIRIYLYVNHGAFPYLHLRRKHHASYPDTIYVFRLGTLH